MNINNFSIIVYLQIITLWTRNNNTYNTSKMVEKHVTSSRLILAFCTFRTIYFAQSDLPEPEKNVVGFLDCRIMTPIDKTPFICRFFLTSYTIFNWAYVFTIMRVRAIVHNDMTSPYYRKHSAVFGKFLEKF